MKKYIALLFTVVAVAVQAQTPSFFVTNNLTAGKIVAIEGNAFVDSMVFYSTNLTPTIIRIYDGNITNYVEAYTNYVSFSTNITTSYVNTQGTTNSYATNNVTYTAPVAHAAGMVNTPPIVSLVIPSNGTVTFTPTTPLIFTTRLTLSNNLTGASCVISYRNP